MSPKKSPSSIEIAVKQIGGRAVKVVQKAAAGGPWTVDAIERAAEWLSAGSKEGGLQRPWPNLASRLRNIIASAKTTERPHGATDDAAPATPQRARATKPKKAAVTATATDNAPTPPAASTTGLTLPDLAERFLKHLESVGKSRGTVFSYSLDLNVAVRHFGEERDVTTVTEEEVAAYYASDAVQKNRNAGPKNAITIAKLQRTLRLALVWAAETGLIAEAPIPPKADSAEPTNDATTSPETAAPPKAKRRRNARVTTPHGEPVAATGA